MRIYKVVMFGGREWGKLGPIRREVLRLKKKAAKLGRDLVVIEGKAPGADQAAGVIAKAENVHVCEVGALWDIRHRGAGPQRNEVMKLLEPTEGICFHEDLSRSTGSADMKRRLERAGIPVKVVAK